MPVSQILCPECGTLMPIKPGRRKQSVRCPDCGEKLDVDLRPGRAVSDSGEAPAVGSGVASFESASREDLAERRKRRSRSFGGGEFGGVGDLIFNPMGGQAAAMNAVGSGASLLFGLILLVLLVAFSWFLPLFSGWARDPLGWSFRDVIAQVPLGAHIGLAILGLITPFVLFLLLAVPSMLFFRRATISHLFLTTQIVFVPFLILFAFATVGLVFKDTLRDAAISFNEVFGDGLLSDNENYTLRISLWFGVGLICYAVLHPVLLVYASLRNVIGFSEGGAFFVTPAVIGLCGYFSEVVYRQAFVNWNLFGISDAFRDLF